MGDPTSCKHDVRQPLYLLPDSSSVCVQQQQQKNIMGKHLMFTTSLIFEGNVSIGNNLRPMSSNLAPNWAKHCQTEAEVGIHLGFHWVSCESAFNCLDTSWDL